MRFLEIVPNPFLHFNQVDYDFDKFYKKMDQNFNNN